MRDARIACTVAGTFTALIGLTSFTAPLRTSAPSSKSARTTSRARLHICRGRDHGAVGGPFDFITWFEFAPSDGAAFDELVGMLRATEEWTYVEREVDIRLRRST